VFQLLPFLKFRNKTLYVFLFSPKRATCRAHRILFDLINRIIFGDEYKSRSSFYSFLHLLVTLYISGPNMFLRTLFSKTLSLCSFLNVRDQVSHPHNNRQHYGSISSFISLDSKQQAFPACNLLLSSLHRQL
jgi:hypothetical protein